MCICIGGKNSCSHKFIVRIFKSQDMIVSSGIYCHIWHITPLLMYCTWQVTRSGTILTNTNSSNEITLMTKFYYAPPPKIVIIQNFTVPKYFTGSSNSRRQNILRISICAIWVNHALYRQRLHHSTPPRFSNSPTP